MSNDTLSRTAQESKDDFLEECCYIAATALCCFDYCLTFAQEVQYVFRRPHSLTSFLFYVLRYTAVLNTIFTILEGLSGWKGESDLSCTILVRTEMGMNIMLLTSAAIFSAMRVYALYSRSVPILVITMVLGLVNPAISLYIFIMSSPGYWADFGCGMDTFLDLSVWDDWVQGARVSSVAADALVLILTWRKTYGIWSNVKQNHIRAPLVEVILADGTIYFLLNLIINVIGMSIFKITLLSEVSATFIATTTSVLTCRFILDLRQASSREVFLTRHLTTHGIDLQTISFRVPAQGRHELDTTSMIFATVDNNLTWEDRAVDEDEMSYCSGDDQGSYVTQASEAV